MAKTLSTITLAPISRAMAATAAMSVISSSGLAGLSIRKTLVFGRTAARQAARSGAVHHGGLDPEPRRPVVEDPAVGAEQRPARHDMIAGPHQPHQRQVHRRHARRLRAAGLGAFQQRQPVLEHLHGRIGVARVDEARLVAGEAGVGALGAVVDVALGQKERLGGLAERRAHRAAAHQAGGDFPVLGLSLVASSAITRLHEKGRHERRRHPHEVKAAAPCGVRRRLARLGPRGECPPAHDPRARRRHPALPGHRGPDRRGRHPAPTPFAADQVQPASLDLRLGERAWRVRASFLPGSGARSPTGWPTWPCTTGPDRAARCWSAAASISPSCRAAAPACRRFGPGQSEELHRPGRCLRARA